MKFQISTTLGVHLEPHERLTEVLTLFKEALSLVLEENLEFSTVKEFFVSPGRDNNEMIVGLRFDGMKAKYVEDTGDEILDLTIQKFHKIADGTRSVLEESVSLQPVLA